MTWQGSSGGDGNSCSTHQDQWQLRDSSDAQIQYRFTPDISIERSSDGGQSWTRELDLNGDDARTSYIGKTGQLYYSQPAGPVAAVIDQLTGNLIAAMGYEGALVRTPDGVWRWVAVGDYHLPDLRRVDNVVVLLSGELLYTLALLALAFSTLVRPFGSIRIRDALTGIALALGWVALVPVFVLEGNVNMPLSILLAGLLLGGLLIATRRAVIAGRRQARVSVTLRTVLAVITWLGWIMAVVLFPSAKANGYGASIPAMAALTVALFAVPMMLGQMSALISRNRRALLPTIFIAAAAICVDLLINLRPMQM